MFALVESGKITQMPKGNKGITLNGNQYPASIYTLWTEAEREFSGGKVKGTYGTATAKAIADADATDNEGNKLKDADGNQVIDYGLKTIKKEMIDNQCAGILAPSDWRVVKATETGGTMDSGWKTWRASVRTKCNSMQTQIDNASDVDALAALFTYTEQSDGSITRPLGEFPVKE